MCAHVMHGRRDIVIDPSRPYTSAGFGAASGLHRPMARHCLLACLRQSAKRNVERCCSESHGGASCVPLSGPFLRRTLLHVNDSVVNVLICFLVLAEVVVVMLKGVGTVAVVVRMGMEELLVVVVVVVVVVVAAAAARMEILVACTFSSKFME